MLRCVLFGFRFSCLCEVLGVCMCGDCLENTLVGMFLMLGVAVIEVRVFWGVMGCVGGCLVPIIRAKRDLNMDLSDRGRSGKE